MVVNLLKTRNILQHLIIEIIKNNYSSFEQINGDFRILYESYKYLKSELNNKKEIVQTYLEEIITNFISLIKNKVRKSVIEQFIKNIKNEAKKENLNINKKEMTKLEDAKDNDIKTVYYNVMGNTMPKINFNKQLMIFKKTYKDEVKKMLDDEKFETLNEYNTYLSSLNIITNKEKFKEITQLIEDLKNNVIPKNIENSDFYKNVNVVDKMYNDKHGFICDKNLNSDLIKEILKNSQENENYQYLILKEGSKNKFVKSINLRNEMEFYFLYILINNLIKRIGNIIHQNDNNFNYIFNDITTNLDVIMNYKLVKDKNEIDSFKFDTCQSEITSIKIMHKTYKLKDFKDFSKNFININIKTLRNLLGDIKINEIMKKLQTKFNNCIQIDKVPKLIDNISIAQENNIAFYNNYKDLFMLYPEIKDYLSNLINEEYENLNMKNDCLKILDKDKKFKEFIINYIDNYLFANYLYKKIEEINGKNEKNYKEYQNLIEKNVYYDFAKKILKAYEDKCSQMNIINVFEQEKKKVIDMFTRIKDEKNKAFYEQNDAGNLNEINKDNMKKEIEKINSVIKEMNDINIDFVNKKFKDYLTNIDINSYAYSKFDVILYLYQNEYI